MGDFARASELKYGKLAKLEAELSQEQQKIAKVESNLLKEEVTQEDIAKVLSRWTGIPAEKLQKTESQKNCILKRKF